MNQLYPEPKPFSPLRATSSRGRQIPSASAGQPDYTIKSSEPLKVIHYTYPSCSSCWGVEPQLHKLLLKYGNVLEVDYRMGGLLPD